MRGVPVIAAGGVPVIAAGGVPVIAAGGVPVIAAGGVPVIDVAGLGGPPAQRQATARRIGDACESVGFFRITGHGIDPALVAAVRAAGRAFFARPMAEKLAIARMPPAYRGYLAEGGEGLARSLGRADAAADVKEAWSMGPLDVPPGLPEAALALNFAANRWPTEPAAFRAVYEAWYRALAALAARLLGGFALALELPADWFADKIDHHISNVRALHYPSQSGGVAAGRLRAGEHTDYGSLTILLTEGIAGLEVRLPDGAWVAVPDVPDSFVVNIGDLMAQWTNDRFRSTLHRVVNPPAEDSRGRLSVAFFHQPNFDARIECLPSCHGPDRPPRYAPVTSGEHRQLKVSRANTPAAA